MKHKAQETITKATEKEATCFFCGRMLSGPIRDLSDVQGTAYVLSCGDLLPPQPCLPKEDA